VSVNPPGLPLFFPSRSAAFFLFFPPGNKAFSVELLFLFPSPPVHPVLFTNHFFFSTGDPFFSPFPLFFFFPVTFRLYRRIQVGVRDTPSLLPFSSLTAFFFSLSFEKYHQIHSFPPNIVGNFFSLCRRRFSSTNSKAGFFFPLLVFLAFFWKASYFPAKFKRSILCL